MNKKTEEIPLYTKNGKVRKRKPKTKNMYFTQETEDAIVEYLASTDPVRRNYLFNTKINYALHKLSENIIHTFKFYYLDVDTLQELKHECVSLLITKLNGYDQSLGKAYSYLGTILKRYLIVYNRKNFKRLKTKGDIEEVEVDKNINNELLNDFVNQSPVSNAVVISHFIRHVDDNMEALFPKEKDKKVVNAIIQIFERRNNIDTLSKKALYIYIREITDISTPNITNIIKKLRTVYKSVESKHV